MGDGMTTLPDRSPGTLHDYVCRVSDPAGKFWVWRSRHLRGASPYCGRSFSYLAAGEDRPAEPPQRQREEGPEDADQEATKDVTRPMGADVDTAQG